MNIQDLIDKRNSLNNLQLLSLQKLLGYRQKQHVKQKVNEITTNKFYTLFDGNEFSKKFVVRDSEIDYVSKNRNIELNAIRLLILVM